MMSSKLDGVNGNDRGGWRAESGARGGRAAKRLSWEQREQRWDRVVHNGSSSKRCVVSLPSSFLLTSVRREREPPLSLLPPHAAVFYRALCPCPELCL